MLIESDTVLPGHPLPDQPVRLTEPTLYAVLRGEAQITASGATHQITSNTALWVPAGSLVAIQPGPGTIVLPVPALPSASAGPTQVAVEPHHLTGLLHEFSCALGHLEGTRSSGVEVRVAEPTSVAPPPTPGSQELQDLAELLADDPELSVADAVDAAITGWSVRTVQRRFNSETGMTLSAWVRHARISTAAELIAHGRSIEWVAHRVGYQSVAGFTRGFTDLTGLTPGQWRRDSQARTSAPSLGTATAPPVPAGELRVPGAWERRTHRTWSRVNGSHIAVWAADGPSQVTVGERSLTLRPGEAVILPAGVRNDVRIPPGSILLPIGFRSGSSGAIGAPLQPANLGSWGTQRALDTVESMLAAYTDVGTTGVAPERGFDAVLTESQRHPVDAGDAMMAALSSVVSREGLTEGADVAAALGVSERTIRSIVLERTGEPFAAWLRQSRMTRARTRLTAGESASDISRTLGYAHLPAFSRAFRAVHGTGPSSVGPLKLRPTHASLPPRTPAPASAPT